MEGRGKALPFLFNIEHIYFFQISFFSHVFLLWFIDYFINHLYIKELIHVCYC
jgi:hypothetical protein